MEGIQIYLDKELNNAIKIQSKITKKEPSQIIREILRDKLLTSESDFYSLNEIAGIWSDRDFDVNECISEKRKGDRLYK